MRALNDQLKLKELGEDKAIFFSSPGVVAALVLVASSVFLGAIAADSELSSVPASITLTSLIVPPIVYFVGLVIDLASCKAIRYATFGEYKPDTLLPDSMCHVADDRPQHWAKILTLGWQFGLVVSILILSVIYAPLVSFYLVATSIAGYGLLRLARFAYSIHIKIRDHVNAPIDKAHASKRDQPHYKDDAA